MRITTGSLRENRIIGRNIVHIVVYVLSLLKNGHLDNGVALAESVFGEQMNYTGNAPIPKMMYSLYNV